MNGLLIIDKPEGWTSHDVVARVRRILKTKRVGHTGTLDPYATGVLVVLVGKTTRLAQFLEKDEKEYEAIIQFGFETDTGDLTGSRTADCGLRTEEIATRLQEADWSEIFNEFIGEIEQIPPMYSAKKVKGQKLYELARKGIIAERAPFKVAVRELEILADSQIRDRNSQIRIRVVCSAGTYIRTLAEDIGRRIGIGAHLAELRRIRAGKFGLEQSVTISTLETDGENLLIPIEEAVSHLPVLVLADERIDTTRNGLPTRVNGQEFSKHTAIQMTDARGNLLAIGLYDADENAVRPKIVLS